MGFTRVLVPVDFTPGSINVLQEAVGMSAFGAREVHALHLYDAGGLEHPVASAKQVEAEAAMERMLAQVVAKGVDVIRGEVRSGPDAKYILKAVEDLKIDLIVLGSHGKKPMEELLYGSLSEQVTREAPVPVLFIRFPLVIDQTAEQVLALARHTADSVLHPTDFSECSGRALDAALEMDPKRIVLATVVDDAGVPPEEIDGVRQSMLGRLATIQKRISRDGLEIITKVAVGDPAETLLKIADMEKATMIALGSRGKGLMTETILGSVSASIMRAAHIPVLVVH